MYYNITGGERRGRDKGGRRGGKGGEGERVNPHWIHNYVHIKQWIIKSSSSEGIDQSGPQVKSLHDDATLSNIRNSNPNIIAYPNTLMHISIYIHMYIRIYSSLTNKRMQFVDNVSTEALCAYRWCSKSSWFLVLIAICPVVLKLWTTWHFGTILLCAEVSNRPVHEVYTIEEIHHCRRWGTGDWVTEAWQQLRSCIQYLRT